MVGNRRQMVVRKAKGKGIATGLAGAGTVAAFALGWPWWLGVAGIVGTGYLAFNWLKFRGKNGLRF